MKGPDDYNMASQMASLLIQQRQSSGGALQPADIRDVVSTVFEQPMFERLGDADFEMLVKELESRFETVIGIERQLLGDDEGWTPWLLGRRGSIEWKYWQRYRSHLEQSGFSEAVLSRLDDSTDRVVGLLGDPDGEGAWDRRGLVVGLVQSGKTAHYIGTINKAVDAGYEVLVILTGVNENLRYQTQIRVEEGLLGYSLEPDPSRPRSAPVARECGVGLIRPLRPLLDSVTRRRDDFKTGIAKQFGISPGGRPLVFVVKKNATILRNLINWVVNFASRTDSEGHKFVEKVPLLVIDDESDVCSIDTRSGAIDTSGDADPEHDPTKINKQIRKLLALFDKSSYVGYTATPFANVLIHDLSEAGVDPDDGLLIGEDLFPKSFIVSLPTPSNHVGPALIFGTSEPDGDGERGLPVHRTIHDTEKGDKPSDHWMPGVHRINHVPRYCGKDQVPPSLREAIHAFVLACCARHLRGNGREHNSMLVHVTRFVRVQERVHDQILREIQDIRNRLRNAVATDSLITALRELWEGDFLITTAKIREREGALFDNPEHSWSQIESQLRTVVESIVVRKIHGQSGEDLDYEHHPDGLNVIAIGGDKLSRGLTLDGLSVSYFLRSSRMYDTLMQMGRWFGYRPGYLDLCRLYTTDELCEWFTHIGDATEELREELGLMANLGCTPKQFSLRVRSHPTMMVTSAVKMRHGTKHRVSFQGDIVETIDFSRKPDRVRGNWEAGRHLIHSCRQSGVPGTPSRSSSLHWSKVPTEAIVEFLEGYVEHSTARKVKTDALREYILKESDKGRLVRWHVLVAAGDGEAMPVADDLEIPTSVRRWHPDDNNDTKEDLIESDHYRIRRLVSPSHEKTGLTESQVRGALDKTRENWRDDPRPGREGKEPRVASGKLLRKSRDETEGLLILYPLSPDDRKAETTELPIIGFAISFPSVDALTATAVEYVGGSVFEREERSM